MPFIKEPITELIFSYSYSDAYDNLLAKLRELHLDVKSHDKKRGEIVVCCVAKVFNMILWKCFIDKLLFEVNEIAPNKTKVNVLGLPNLFKIRASHEEMIDLNTILMRIKQ